jgi:hypothetical protein
MDGRCECGKTPINHHFVLTNPSGVEIILGSTCIERHNNYTYLFKDAQAWNNLKRRISANKELYKLIKGSDDWKKQKWTLKKLNDLMRVNKLKYKNQTHERKMRTDNMMPEIEAIEWATGNSFIHSVFQQAKTGASLTDRQVEVYEKIRDEFINAEHTTVEIIKYDYNEWKSKPHFEDDFGEVTNYLRMWVGDLDKVRKLKLVSRFTDAEMDIADKLLYKYRKQLKENYDRELGKVKDYGDNDFSNAYIEAYGRIKGGGILDR